MQSDHVHKVVGPFPEWTEPFHLLDPLTDDAGEAVGGLSHCKKMWGGDGPPHPSEIIISSKKKTKRDE